MTKPRLFAVLLLAQGLAACVPADHPASPGAPEQPRAMRSDGITPTVYHDPGGCQYLVFRGVGPTMAVVPRQQPGTSGYCFRSDR